MLLALQLLVAVVAFPLWHVLTYWCRYSAASCLPPLFFSNPFDVASQVGSGSRQA